jgi:hypothetical protein
MTNKQVYSLCESLADIAYIAGKEDYEIEDSRRKFEQFIEWAREFEWLHRNVEWGVNFEPEYIDSIYHFTIFKIDQWRIVMFNHYLKL